MDSALRNAIKKIQVEFITCHRFHPLQCICEISRKSAWNKFRFCSGSFAEKVLYRMCGLCCFLFPYAWIHKLPQILCHCVNLAWKGYSYFIQLWPIASTWHHCMIGGGPSPESCAWNYTCSFWSLTQEWIQRRSVSFSALLYFLFVSLLTLHK